METETAAIEAIRAPGPGWDMSVLMIKVGIWITTFFYWEVSIILWWNVRINLPGN